jgi:hypothetical protein
LTNLSRPLNPMIRVLINDRREYTERRPHEERGMELPRNKQGTMCDPMVIL